MVPYLVPRVMSKMIHKRPAPLNSKKWTLMISKNLKLTNWLLYQNPNLEPIVPRWTHKIIGSLIYI